MKTLMSEIVTAYHDAMSRKSPDALADLYAEDGLHEFPFGGLPPYQGRERIRAGYRASWGTSPAEVQEIRNVLIHHSTDPEVLVVEQETVVKVGDRFDHRARPADPPDPRRPDRPHQGLHGRHRHRRRPRRRLTSPPVQTFIPVRVPRRPPIPYGSGPGMRKGRHTRHLGVTAPLR